MPKPRRSTHAAVAEQLGLRIIDKDELTFARRPHGEHFRYVDAEGGALPPERRREIEALVLPPAWSDVAIAADARAHLQAIGRDGQGRVQYRYHDDWARVRDAVKAERLRAFGRALPRIRERVERDLARPLSDRRAVLATAVRLIDRQLLRVGGERYAAMGTRGASTLEARNTHVKNGRVELRYRAKAGKKVSLRLRDKRLADRVKRLRRMKGRRLFAWRDETGTRRRLGASQINEYLVDLAHGHLGRRPAIQVSAKDFRTFAASALAVEDLCAATADTPTARKRALAAAMRRVAERLRNTPAVARSSYVHPLVVRAFEAGELDPGLVRGPVREGLDHAETGLMRLLER